MTLPDGFAVRLGGSVRVRDGGRTLVGGAPLRVSHLSVTARRLLAGGTLVVGGSTSRRLAERLLASGMAEAVLDRLEPVSLDQVTCVVSVRDNPRGLTRLLTGLRSAMTTVVVDDAFGDLGPGGARNTGLRKVTTPYVVFVDSDVVVAPELVADRRHAAEPDIWEDQTSSGGRMSEDVSDQGERAGQEARHSTTMRAGARVGLVAYGVVHLLIAGIALQVAWSSGGDASGGGALRKLAEQPFGGTLLWITVLGLVVLALWQLLSAILGYRSEGDEKKRTFNRLSAAARTIAYGVLAFVAARTASGSGGSGGRSNEEGFTAELLAAPSGRVLVGAVATLILALALGQAWRGITDGFTNDLKTGATTGQSASTVLALGRTGYVAKGVAFGIVAVLFGTAAVTYDADKAGGLDDALGTLREQPFGPYLLTVVALGIAAFGVFCFVWARHVRTR